MSDNVVPFKVKDVKEGEDHPVQVPPQNLVESLKRLIGCDNQVHVRTANNFVAVK